MEQLDEIVQEFAELSVHSINAYWYNVEPHSIESGFKTVKSGFIFPIRGSATCNFNGTSFEVCPGYVLHGSPGMILDTEYGEEGMEFCLLLYTAEKESYYTRSNFLLASKLDLNMIEMLREIHASYFTPGVFSALTTKMHFWSIINKLFNDLRHPGELGAQDLEERVADYIKARYMEPITIEAMAERFEVDVKHLAYRFRKHTGLSPKEFLIQCRMTHAKQLLHTTGYTIQQIAQKVGYQDAYYFSRLFKKYVGMSPTSARLI